MAISFGCHPQKLAQQFSQRELQTLITHQMTKNGFTFDKQEIAKINAEAEKQRHENFRRKAQEHWNQKHGN